MRVETLREMLADEARAEPVTTGDPVGVVVRRARHARNRRRARFGAAATVLVAAAVALAAIATGSHGTDHPKVVVTGPSERLDVVALATRAVPNHGESSELLYIDADSGQTTSRSIPLNNYGDYPVQLLRIGDQLLMPGGDTVRSAPFDLSSPPRDIAPALVFVPSVHPDRFWAITHFQFGNTPPFTVTEFDASGHATSKPLALPPDAGWPIAGTNEGLLVEAAQANEVWLWNPDTGLITRRISTVDRFDGDDWAGPDLFAWTSPCNGQAVTSCATLHLLDLRTGDQRDIAPPAGSTGFEPDGSLSPDATTLAVFTTTSAGAQHLALVNIASGAVTTVLGADHAGGPIAWSPDGTTVFFGTDDATGIARYHLGDATSTQLRTNLATLSAIVTGSVTPAK